MKYILVTDTHLGIKQGSPLYHDITKSLFGDIYNLADDRMINQLIHLGDFFDNRKSIPIKTISTALDIVDTCDKVFKDTYLITGNHDTIYKDSMDDSLLSMFSEYKNITVVREPLALGNIVLMPWLFDIELLENKQQRDILIGHFDIAGAVMNESGTESKHGIKQSALKNWKMVLSGHYHTPGIYGNIQYLGSPFHTSFNDVEGTRGFYVLDDETYELEFIEFTDYPKFIRIKDTDNPEDVADKIPGNIVELKFTKDHGIEGNIEIIERINTWSPLTLTPKYVNIGETMSDDTIDSGDIEIKDHLEILQEYIDHGECPEHLNITMLHKVAEKLYKETINV